MCFELVYFGHFTYHDVELMPIYQREAFHKRLVAQKERENGKASG